MPKVQVSLADGVHSAVRVEAAVRGLSIAATVEVLVAEALELVGVPEKEGRVSREETGEVPDTKSAVAEFQPVPFGKPVVASDWSARDFSKARQARRNKK